MRITELSKATNALSVRMRENRTSLIVLATDAGLLAREFEKLRVSLRNKHEENQRNDIDSDS
jgi:L-aminopeptidase/D-esterase-like protein